MHVSPACAHRKRLRLRHLTASSIVDAREMEMTASDPSGTAVVEALDRIRSSVRHKIRYSGGGGRQVHESASARVAGRVDLRVALAADRSGAARLQRAARNNRESAESKLDCRQARCLGTSSETRYARAFSGRRLEHKSREWKPKPRHE